jgi:ABC-type antimicrobial peptide transport system permease subunit
MIVVIVAVIFAVIVTVIFGFFAFIILRKKSKVDVAGKLALVGN